MAAILKMSNISLRSQYSRIRAGVLVGAFAFLLNGCSPSCSTCGPTPEIVNEMNTLGVTIGSLTSPESTVEQAFVRSDSSVFPPHKVALVDLYFAPKTAVFSREDDQLSAFPYRFSFSTLDGGGFTEIPQSDIVNLSYFDDGPYSGYLRLVHNPSHRFERGDFLLSPRHTRIPDTATHIELWLQPDIKTQRELVRRVPLSSLSGWARFFE